MRLRSADRLDCQRLAQLHAEGMLSREEYTQLKASLLAAHMSAHADHEPRGAASSGP